VKESIRMCLINFLKKKFSSCNPFWGYHIIETRGVQLQATTQHNLLCPIQLCWTYWCSTLPLPSPQCEPYYYFLLELKSIVNFLSIMSLFRGLPSPSHGTHSAKFLEMETDL